MVNKDWVHLNSNMYIRPGYLSKFTTNDRERKNIMEQSLGERMMAAGMKNVPKSLLDSNQGSNCKGIDFVLFNGEEILSSNSDNDDPVESKADKVKGTHLGKKQGSSAPLLRNLQNTQEEGGSPQGATQSQQLPTSLTEETNMFCNPHTVVDNVDPAIPSRASQNPKRKRGPTKLKTIVVDGSSRIEVMFDENGQPIGDGSIKLSSFLGPLVREIVPYTLSDWRKLPTGMAEILWQSIKVRFNLHEEWHREVVFRMMNADWRASKSILVRKIRKASNEEERLKLQPDNVKSLRDWKDFVKEKTSESFKLKSENFSNMRKKQLELQHTMSRKGYPRLIDELKKEKKVDSVSRVVVWTKRHTNKNGQPRTTTIAKKITDMGKIEHNEPNSTNLKEDAVSKVIGAERRGRVRTFGKGVTLTRLAMMSQTNSQIAQLHEENAQMKSQMSDMQNTFIEFMKSQVQNPTTSEGTPTTPIATPFGACPPQNMSHNTKCKLLDWMGTGDVVAEGRWASSDPHASVHCIPLGPDAMKVWVDVAKKPDVFLWRTSSEMTYMEEAVGSAVAWPDNKVIMDNGLDLRHQG